MKIKEKIKIEKGFRAGKLIVSEDSGKRKNGYTIWKCICGCGTSIDLDTRTLQRGTVRDCGCETKVKPGQKDLTGERFGWLTALEPTAERGAGGSAIWKCRCDCGKEITVAAKQLTQGSKKSCGCRTHPPKQELLGKQFGNLTVTAFEEKRGGCYYWRCKCSCGKETVVRQNYLTIGKTKSCGCLQARIITENLKIIDGTSITLLENTAKRLGRTNSSGHNGVYFNQKAQKWIAQIGFKGKNYYLGSYEKLEDAAAARKKAEDRVYGEFIEWYYTTYSDKQPPSQ